MELCVLAMLPNSDPKNWHAVLVHHEGIDLMDAENPEILQLVSDMFVEFGRGCGHNPRVWMGDTFSIPADGHLFFFKFPRRPRKNRVADVSTAMLEDLKPFMKVDLENGAALTLWSPPDQHTMDL